MKKKMFKFNVALILFGLLSITALLSKPVTPIIYLESQNSYVSSHNGFKIVINEQGIKFYSNNDSLKNVYSPDLTISFGSNYKIEKTNSLAYLNLYTEEIVKEEIPLIQHLKLNNGENTITFSDDGKIEFEIGNYSDIKFSLAKDIQVSRIENLISFHSLNCEFSFSLPSDIDVYNLNENEIEFIFNTDKTNEELQSTYYEISYLTYLGKSDQPDRLMSIDVDNEGNYYVCGFTESSNFYVLNPDTDLKYRGSLDGFISKFDKDNNLLWSSYWGGGNRDYLYRIRLDSKGNAWVAGDSESSEIPMRGNSFDNTLAGNSDALLGKFSNDGKLLYSTLAGGESYDSFTNFSIDANDNIWCTGRTVNADFPVTADAYQKDYKGDYESFIMKFDNDGGLIYSSFMGGSGADFPEAFHVGKDFSVVQAGFTNSKDFPVINIANSIKAGEYDMFVAKYDSTGIPLWSRYIGGTADDKCNNLIVDDDGFIYISGYVRSTKMPVSTDAFQKQFNGKMDLFIAKLSPDGEIIKSTFFGGRGIEGLDVLWAQWGGMTINESGNILVSGSTTSTDFPMVGNPMIDKLQGNTDGFIIELSPDLEPLWSTYLGGSDDDEPKDIKAINDKIYSVGWTSSRNLKTNDESFQEVYGGNLDGYIAIITNPESSVLNIENRIIDFGKVEIGSFKDTIQVLTIKCIGERPMKITETRHYLPNDSDFTTIAGGGNFIIQNNTTHKMDLKFTPSFVGKTSGTLEFHFEGDYSPLVIQLLGEGVFSGIAVVQLYPESRQANVGDIVEIPIMLINSSNLQYSGITGFNLEFDYNSTLLAPIEETAFYKSENWSSIKLNNLPAIEGEIGRIKFAACLGNSESTPLLLSNVETIGGNADIRISDGVFKLLDLCYEGGLRLINPASSLINSVSPNPAESDITIDFQLSEKGRTEITITNYMGEIISQKVYQEVSNFGNFKEIFDLKNYSSGYYNIFIKTPTMLESKGFVIIRN